MSHLGKIESLLLPSPSGKLEVQWKHQPVPAGRMVVICHPLSTHGGTMHNKVVFHASKAFFENGFDVIRFNFRGVGQSSGSFDEGRGEQDDLKIVLHEARKRSLQTEIVLCGYSFGSFVAASVARSEAVAALVLIAPPAEHYAFDFLRQLRLPTVLVFAENDAFSSAAQRSELGGWVGAPNLKVTLPADHFFESQLDALQRLLSGLAIPFIQFSLTGNAAPSREGQV
ncbi:MAG TPA: alpha/beta fold hydrolase [Acidobacteriota bacterium]|jgi:hypothetical protein